jgi:hypothetical protein
MTLSIFSNIFNVGASRNPGTYPGATDPQPPAQDIKILGAGKTGTEDSVELSQKQLNRKIRFDIDPETHDIVIKVVDADTGKELKQIPDEQLQKMSKLLGEYTNLLQKSSDKNEKGGDAEKTVDVAVNNHA